VEVSCSAIAILLFTAISAHAAEEGGNATTDGRTKYSVINFAIVAGLIAWVFLKLTPLFSQNAETISSAISKATAAKAEAERQLREAEEKLARLEQEVTPITVRLHSARMAAETERLKRSHTATLES